MVSAGALATPQILQRFGVGAATNLKASGIENVISDLQSSKTSLTWECCLKAFAIKYRSTEAEAKVLGLDFEKYQMEAFIGKHGKASQTFMMYDPPLQHRMPAYSEFHHGD